VAPPKRGLSRADVKARREAAFPADGEYSGALTKAAQEQKETGLWLHLQFTIETGHIVPMSVCLDHVPGARHAALAADGQDLLLDLFAAVLGVDAVEDTGAAVMSCMQQPVMMSIVSRKEKGTTRTRVTRFWTAASQFTTA
jgi:hypothetical protein